MQNIFMKNESHNIFRWDKLGNIKKGRTALGEEMPVMVYRLLEYTLNHVLCERYGPDISNDIFRAAGYLAGSEFAKNVLSLDQNLESFITTLQETLKELKIGILRMEEFDKNTGYFVLTIGEDLDCSGLPPTNEIVCNYDEGFLSGIMEEYTKTPYEVKEIDCWANGDRVCRFEGNKK